MWTGTRRCSGMLGRNSRLGSRMRSLDTLFLRMRRVAQNLIWAVSVSFLLVACATIGPPQPPSLELPQPPTDLRASRKGDRVSLSWTIPTLTTDRQTIRSLGPTGICRGTGRLQACNTPVGEIKTPLPRGPGGAAAPKPQASYADTLPPQLESDDPSAFATYAVDVLNRESRGAGLSNQAKVPLVRTLAPPRDLRAGVAREGVVLSWTGDLVPVAVADVHHVYRVYRRLEGSSEVVLAGEVPAGSATSFSLTDASIEWQKTYLYRAEAVTAIPGPNNSRLEVEGDDTPELKVFADDRFPPAVPAGLQAVFSGPGQKPFVDLVWAPVTDPDLAGYNVYRHEDSMSPVKLNTELVKAPAYRDESVTSGKKYFYSVSSVDVRGNESAKSEEASEAVP